MLCRRQTLNSNQVEGIGIVGLHTSDALIATVSDVADHIREFTFGGVRRTTALLATQEGSGRDTANRWAETARGADPAAPDRG